MTEIPDTAVECDGCGETLSLLVPYLAVQVKAQRNVLLSTETQSEDPNEVGDVVISLGTKSGKGAIKRFHNFDCMESYASDRSGQEAKLEFHEEDEIYVPEDNRTPEELVEAGELDPAFLSLHKALNEED